MLISPARAAERGVKDCPPAGAEQGDGVAQSGRGGRCWRSWRGKQVTSGGDNELRRA